MNGSEPLGLLLDQAQDKIALVDDEGRFTFVNGASERILGIPPAELVGEVAFEYIHPDDREAVRAAFQRTITSDGFAEETVEYRHRTADGSWVWLESRMSNLTDDELDGYVVSSRDVTDRVRAERQRAEATSHLKEIAAVSGDVLWMFDADWSELLFVNPAYEDIYGTPTDEIRGDPDKFLDAVHPDDRPAVEEAMKLLAAGDSVDIEYRVNPEENYNRWVWVQGEPIIEDGEVVRITGFTKDVTDRRRRERQLVVMDNLLRHNLRNELNIVLGTVEDLEADVPEAAEHTAVIRRVGERLLQTAEKEREVIDLITDQRETDRIDLRSVVEGCVETVRDRYPEGSITVDGLDAVTVDGRCELRSAVTELLENPFQHSDDGRPTVTVRLRRTDDGAELVIEDDLPAIPSVEADVLTGDHDMTHVYHSSGLGFWVVYWSVELSNGDVAVDSDPAGRERGNRITVSLPRAAK
ncbi:PAS domain S-box protein [Halorubrum ezzemoulense]|jgi:PAS domain S-box-containing protein|uniref:histidine kinase n=1 Tax=Halorubrum ezzemoulense TaxID=337243 RepID=A0ABT4Z423_HALEZ|nr:MULTISPECIES: PAS domain S-box protein [Halorubrum]MDB2244892.1 PAS domain S-box protein [Halorubrum ezzemoulense]MDB2251099.1 PAS domain S-box protein [Halorubrum ezzemoulense]MDB2278351.1 PAS domain S-box protein [Halorubrum ezzemoulense]MDB2285025.1 PAS domain S-box protein [Halorubrum ezzemoulense]MDB2288226.1 PAS domain S-box protein [Halorubrum ezzemoulense]